MIWVLGGYVWLFIHRPFEVWNALGDLQFERIYVLIMLLLWLVSPGKHFVPNRVHLALALLTVAIIGCWYASPYQKEGTLVLEAHLKLLVFYVLVITTIHDERGLRTLLMFYLGSVGLYTLHSFAEFMNGRIEWRQGISRMVGVDATLNDPNAFASTVLLAIPMLLPFWKEAKGTRARALIAGAAGFWALCILLTGSRSAFIGLCAAGFLYGWHSRYRVRMLVLMPFVGVLLLAVLPGYLHDRFMTLVDPSLGPANAQASADGRLEGFLAGMSLWASNPATGVGPGAFALASGKGFQAHNVYGQVAGELGTLGITAFVMLLTSFYRNHREARRRAQEDGRQLDFPLEVSRAVTLVVLLLLLTGWAGHNLYRYNWEWLAAFQAIALHCLRRRVGAVRPVAAGLTVRGLAMRPATGA
jgi:O-antigen ligase